MSEFRLDEEIDKFEREHTEFIARYQKRLDRQRVFIIALWWLAFLTCSIANYVSFNIYVFGLNVIYGVVVYHSMFWWCTDRKSL